MSTKVKCTSCGSGPAFGFDGADPNRTVDEFYITLGAEGHYVLRSALLAAVETECGVRMVPADAIVLDLASCQTIVAALLARVEYPDSHPPTPPVAEADVEALAGLLRPMPFVRFPSDVACQLLSTGRVSVTHE